MIDETGFVFPSRKVVDKITKVEVRTSAKVNL